MIEDTILDIIERTPVDARIDPGLFEWLRETLRREGTGEASTHAHRLAGRKIVDHVVPDDDQMLYLLLMARAPLAWVERLRDKPYERGIKVSNGRSSLVFNSITKILAESSIEHQPLTIIGNVASLTALEKKLRGCTYDLPPTSRVVCHVSTMNASIPQCEDILGVPHIDRLYRPSGMASYGFGAHFPAWVQIEKENDTLSFIDLATFESRGRVVTTEPTSNL